MKITTEISVLVERPDGTTAYLERSTIMATGDNPRFERDGVAGALHVAHVEFVAANHLGSEDGL